MTLLLGIETSSPRFGVVLGEGDAVRFDSSLHAADLPARDVAGLVRFALEHAGASARDVGRIAVNVGPGGLGSIRAGVAFANALAFSLGVPICPLDHFEILGTQAARDTHLPVLCAVSAAAGQAYVGLFRNGAVTGMRFGPLASLVAETAAGLDEVAVVGRLRGRMAALLPGTRVVDTGIETPDPAILLPVSAAACARPGGTLAQVAPINEQSAIFHASS
jgi:tRNA threonylcarbamoyladenosine biosynthesis protein TsaB